MLEKVRLRIYLILFVFVLISSTIVFMITEDLSAFDALYYSIVTVSTVGYGDISPQSDIGKIMAIVLIVAGVGTFLGVIGNATEIFIKREEDKKRDKKVHILLGLLFSELGNKLLAIVQKNDITIESTRKTLHFDNLYKQRHYKNLSKDINQLNIEYGVERCDFAEIYNLIKANKEFLMRMLENPMLLEGEQLTELIRDIFHLYEEFTYRLNIDDLTKSDKEHLHHDIMRVYKGLIKTWVMYMEYLQLSYPVLYNFNRKQGPFGNL
jgi:hypothetical protein